MNNGTLIANQSINQSINQSYKWGLHKCNERVNRK